MKQIKKLFCKLFTKKNAPILVGGIMLIFLILIPTGFEQAIQYQEQIQAKVEIIQTDESHIISSGLIKSGEQNCTVKILNSVFKGETYTATNLLNGSLENDKIYKNNDKALAMISHKDGQIQSISLIDHYRINKELLLCALFIILLVAFAGKMGVRALLSFGVTILMIWKLLIPLYLNGVNPIFTSLIIVVVLSSLCISLVYGFDKRCLATIIGTLLGITTTAILGAVFTNIFQIHGAVMPNSESLIYSGYEYLNLTQIFVASIIIGASGATMDLAIDISSAMSEII